jgi:NADH-quinone oxidoreductase subunit C/D
MTSEPAPSLTQDLTHRFGGAILGEAPTRDTFSTLWLDPRRSPEVVRWLSRELERPFSLLTDVFAVDERARGDKPARDFTWVAHLYSPERDADLRLEAPLLEGQARVPSLASVFPNAAWYEREAFDMFGVEFEGHPNLRRILTPASWRGHPLLKSHPSRATELGPLEVSSELLEADERDLAAEAAAAGLPGADDDAELMILSMGPNHPATHGVLRVLLALDGERVVAAHPEVGFHHRGVEKIAERQTWHGFIPYTDRVDYLGGVLNEIPYLSAVERLAGIEPPPRAKVARIMLSELFRIMSHLLFYGTMAQDVGALSPVFYMFRDRERAYRIVEAITGARMHPGWFRIGGLAQDLPEGWAALVREFLDYLPGRLRDYDRMVLRNRMFRARTVGVGAYAVEEALRWGVTGPGLRAAGLPLDFRKRRPPPGFEGIDFDVPVGTRGDSYDRTVVRVEEMRQSLRIIEQCLEHMPAGPVLADHPLTTPPPRARALRDIETMIHGFMHGSWGPVLPAGEVTGQAETARGLTQYTVFSDRGRTSYRTRIRTPSFAHLQMLPEMVRGLTVADVVATLGSIDFVLSDVDR